jgi:hypothetical protein
MSDKPRRRWFRFSLRTMLALVVVVAIPLSWVAKERRQSEYEQQIAEQLRQQAFGEIEFGGPYDLLDPYWKPSPQGWWRDLARQVLGGRALLVWGLPHKCNDITPLAGFNRLLWLDLSDTQLSDLTPLAELKNVLELNL